MNKPAISRKRRPCGRKPAIFTPLRRLSPAWKNVIDIWRNSMEQNLEPQSTQSDTERIISPLSEEVEGSGGAREEVEGSGGAREEVEGSGGAREEVEGSGGARLQ